jgi:hypothetical protein
MHVTDTVLDCFSDLFRFHRYPLLEEFCSVIPFTTGLGLRDLSERLYLTGVSRRSVKK